jgi:hypothetical protein
MIHAIAFAALPLALPVAASMTAMAEPVENVVELVKRGVIEDKSAALAAMPLDGPAPYAL